MSTADIDAGHPIYYDLETGRLEETLPFDVQFYLRIPVTDRVKTIEGRYVGDTRPFLCGEAFPKARIYTDYGFGPRQPAPSERRQEQPVSFVRFFKDPAKESKKHAELNVVNGLLPNRYYCFEFIQVRTVDLVAFRQAVADGADHALRGLDLLITGEVILQEGYKDLRAAVIAAVEDQLKPGERLVLPPESFLDQSIEALEPPPAARRSFDDVLQEQGSRANAIINLRKDVTEFVVPSLKKLVLSDDLKKLRSRVGRQPQSKVMAQILRGREKATSWAELNCRPSEDSLELCAAARSAIEAIAEGAKDAPTAIAEAAGVGAAPSPVDAPPSLDDVWVPGDLTVRRENLDRTLSQLRELRGLIVDLRDEGLVSETGVTDEFIALKETVTEAVTELDFLTRHFDSIEATLKTRNRKLNALVADLNKEEVIRVLVEGSTTANFEVRANWYLGVDLGFAWSPDIEDFFSYVGTNIYFRPVNKKAHLRWSDFRRGQLRSELAKRLSLTIGITINDLVTEDEQFQGVPINDDVGLIAKKPLVFTAGLRLSDFFRVSVGALVFKDKDPNPLIDDSKLAWSPLVSLSIDWNLRGALRNRFIR